ncbi:tetratricopeptide repeat protein [Kitasatospora purpeofusca]|uniref:tetratricopeptide repeat protein n=1 Tax=Kitasatospora purpeofusca TaxID=67352 RepID=UPI00225B6560|nr:tetratricopeptide repeat protein [Kitasatospora purpeofusca]MCX4757268.1 tetratricopeptide repeat protein [Kitasatospora purpeofusca]WSR34983.1 tetratricopeptide repeat protein [Kitasatospora purpeofusca]WSR43202.1 tetratricopeptide repeat protein [Kitasatospora purpeofusca]
MDERDERVDDGAGGGADTGGGGAVSSGQQQRSGEPEGDVYEWFRRGARLLAQGNPAAAEQLLARAASAEPDSRSIREALARAQFDAGSYAAALENFRTVALADPSDDYAQFGWGVAAARLGDFEASAEHLALAVAMRPENDHYRAALRQTRATLTARAGGFGPLLPGAPGYLEPPTGADGPGPGIGSGPGTTEGPEPTGDRDRQDG